MKQTSNGDDNIHRNATNYSACSRNLATYTMKCKFGSNYSMNMKQESQQKLTTCENISSNILRIPGKSE